MMWAVDSREREQSASPPSSEADTGRRRGEGSSTARRSAVRAAVGWIALPICVAGVWEWAVARGSLNPIFSGRPSGIIREFWRQIREASFLKQDVYSTLAATTIGFAIAAVAGIMVAFLLSQSRLAQRILDPFFTALNSLPRVALAPLFLIWFGIGLQSKVALAGSLTFFVAYYNTMAGIEAVDRDHLLLAKVLGFSRRSTFFKFVLPSSVPSIFTGLQLGFVYGMLGTVAGEMIAGEHGLGVLLTRQAALFQTDQYFATLLVLVVITTIITSLMSILRRRLLRWQSVHVASSGE